MEATGYNSGEGTMASTFFGLEIGSRGLSSSQTALDVIGHNTSNVNTPGYSRQVTSLEATDPYALPAGNSPSLGQLGTGVNVSAVTRVRDNFIDLRVYDANGQQGANANLRDVLGRVEQAFNEPGTSGIGSQLTKFFNSFSDLSANPESQALRATVRNSAQALVNAFHSVNETLGQIAPDTTGKIQVKVKEANDLAGQIAALNSQIRLSIASGQKPNDLLDKRGSLINQLSTIVPVQVLDGKNYQTGQATGEININVGGFSLVQGDGTNALPATVSTTAHTPTLVTDTGDPVPISGGEVGGLIQASTIVAGYQKSLDTLASGVITTVNSVHAAGVDLNGNQGQAFFSGKDAASLAISGTVQSDLNTIAAAGPPTPPATFSAGNGDNARSLASLAYTPSIGNASFTDFYNTTVSQAGSDSKLYQNQSDNQDKVVSQLKSQQSSVSGVSLDEELTRLLQYQRSYQAAARVVNTFDETLDRIINGLVVTHA